MKIETIESISWPVGFDDYEKIISSLNKNKAVHLRAENSTDDQRASLFHWVGQEMAWNTRHPSGGTWTYRENHEFGIGRSTEEGRNTPDSVIVPWHLENTHYQYPQYGAMWFMHTFKCDKKAGTTGFINSIDLFKSLPDEDREFLRKCTLMCTPNASWGETNEWHASSQFLDGVSRGDIEIEINEPEGTTITAFSKNAVVVHPITGEEVLRMSPGNGAFRRDYLVRVNDAPPSRVDYDRFESLWNWFNDRVRLNDETPSWWQWSPGDLLIVDLLCLIHGVRGGFNVGEREFTGFWAFPRDFGLLKTDDPSQRKPTVM